MTKFVLPIYYTQKFKTKKDKTFLVGLNWYRNAHYMINNKVKKYYHELVEEQSDGKSFDRIVVKYRIYAKRNGTDGHNIRSIIEKYFLDGLVECGIIEDDDTEHVLGSASEFYIDKDNPRCEIELIEVK